ncbi:formylglycine-generating enzyme family protein [Candidatus Leptofilum sp.]|uniref:formylglycine-generating enzyme family protein n=1 Tax=Candidatus Leptofilum sp. TaxID=3241576 RepID=UPI003B5CCA71
MTVEMMVDRLEDLKTAVTQRLQIGQQLAELGDPRPGVSVKNGVPEINWLPVYPGGELMLLRHWQPDTPNETESFRQIGPFIVEPFYISKYLVTYKQYQTFVEAEDGFTNPIWWREFPEDFQQQPLAKQYNPRPNHPRDTVSWYQCVAFARWLNQQLTGFTLPHPSSLQEWEIGKNAQIRLPTEWEWQWAAQNGVEERPFPWGEAQPNVANTAETESKQTTAVGMFPHGAAACGALDMAGNVMEWCFNDKTNPATIDAASTKTKVLRGGDWGYNLANATTNYCDDEKPDGLDPLNGFRLVLGPILQNE